jgi:hypothetical protein
MCVCVCMRALRRGGMPPFGSDAMQCHKARAALIFPVWGTVMRIYMHAMNGHGMHILSNISHKAC